MTAALELIARTINESKMTVSATVQGGVVQITGAAPNFMANGNIEYKHVVVNISTMDEAQHVMRSMRLHMQKITARAQEKAAKYSAIARQLGGM